MKKIDGLKYETTKRPSIYFEGVKKIETLLFFERWIISDTALEKSKTDRRDIKL